MNHMCTHSSQKGGYVFTHTCTVHMYMYVRTLVHVSVLLRSLYMGIVSPFVSLNCRADRVSAAGPQGSPDNTGVSDKEDSVHGQGRGGCAQL